MDYLSAFSVWSWSNSALGAFHLYAALVALAVGPFVFFRRKGDIPHRLFGMVYVIAMYTTNISALSLYDFTGGWNYFHTFAVANLITLTIGFTAIVIYGARPSRLALDTHLQMMPWSYLGLVLAAITEGVVRAFPGIPAGVSPTQMWQIILAVVVGSCVVGMVVTFYLLAPVRRRWIKTSE